MSTLTVRQLRTTPSVAAPGFALVPASGGALQLVKVNFTAVIAPTVNDDSTQGYSAGSQWIDTATDTFYTCVDASTGVAVWVVSIHRNVNAEVYGLTAKTVPVSGDLLLLEDSAASYAKKKVLVSDFLKLAGTAAYQVAQSASTITTSSLTFVTISGMSITPGAGSYLVTFSSTMAFNKNDPAYIQLVANGVADANSLRSIGGQPNCRVPLSTQATMSVADGQTIEAQWRVDTAGVATLYDARVMTLVRVA